MLACIPKTESKIEELLHDNERLLWGLNVEYFFSMYPSKVFDEYTNSRRPPSVLFELVFIPSATLVVIDICGNNLDSKLFKTHNHDLFFSLEACCTSISTCSIFDTNSE
jgi:hypothetical protein